MFDTLKPLARRPEPFSVYTTPAFWNDPHVSCEMLKWHLDPESDPASYHHTKIDAIVGWLDDCLNLNGKTLCDLGCGPGLYTSRFHQRGARVTGIDVSSRSLAHARSRSEGITYIEGNYLDCDLPEGTDVFTMISQDYSALSPSQRETLLGKIRQCLSPGGCFVFDVSARSALSDGQESEEIAVNLQGGFWSARDYIGLRKTWIYEEEKLSVDVYLIVEEDRTWTVYNWCQYFTPESLAGELEEMGFAIDFLGGALDGAELDVKEPQMGVIARPV